ncbi:hypothetical protein [Kitasatospora sp. NPDC088783]|uniref:hypothetical protein n=1 Tax=Kitasatospora sp. NPDC088783 TaxID=3364077 RepID=UPI003823E52B
MQNETYVHDFLLARAADTAHSFEGAAIVELIVNEYCDAINKRRWPAATALGDLMLKLAEQCKDHPDYRSDWKP